MRPNDTNSDTRFSFTAGFLIGAKIMAARATAIEVLASVNEDARLEHRACVVSAIMQAAAAMESEIGEVTMHGPGHHLGSNGLDAVAHEYLLPMADIIDKQNAIARFETVLHLLKKEPLDRSAQTWAQADLLVRLRNEVVHYKSQWGAEMSRAKLWRSLEQLGHPKPPFRDAAENFFPLRCLSAACAFWATRASVTFIDEFYEKLEIASPLDGHRARL